MNVLAVAIGGALGALARYGTSVLMHRAVPGSFPIGTATVNVVGGFAVGLIAGLLTARQVGEPHAAHLFLIVGVCGGFTTFSAFSLETVRLMQEGSGMTAMVSVVTQVVGAVLATGAGLWLARHV